MMTVVLKGKWSCGVGSVEHVLNMLQHFLCYFCPVSPLWSVICSGQVKLLALQSGACFFTRDSMVQPKNEPGQVQENYNNGGPDPVWSQTTS